MGKSYIGLINIGRRFGLFGFKTADLFLNKDGKDVKNVFEV